MLVRLKAAAQRAALKPYQEAVQEKTNACIQNEKECGFPRFLTALLGDDSQATHSRK